MRRNNKKKGNNKIKVRNSTRVSWLCFSIIVFSISSAFLYKSISNDKSTIIQNDLYSYQNNFSSDYSVNIKKNQFISEESLPAGETYVSDLIDSINIKMNYDYSDSQTLPIEYDYKIDAVITAKYSDNGTPYTVWDKTYNLKTVESTKTTSDNLSIKEDLIVDYKKYHQEVLDFKQTLGMMVDASLQVKLTVNTSTNIDSKDVKNIYVSNFSITLGDKIAIADNKTNEVKPGSVKQEKASTISNIDMPKFAFSLVSALISMYIIYYITQKTKKLNSIKNEFKLELNKILKSCQDRIVIVESEVKTDNESVINVKDFGELIKLSEELYKPILCWISDDIEHGEAHFFVISNKVKYIFILKD